MFETATADVPAWSCEVGQFARSVVVASRWAPRAHVKKVWHEFRDPVHGFIRVNSQERTVIDAPVVQRLRHIHQLSLSYQVYPGATHRRFEHSLGVMELAGRVFDVITAQENLTDEVRDLLPEVNETDDLKYWRTVVRLAALLHDIGHLPFSHGAEHELLPEGYSHERITADLVLSDHLAPLLTGLPRPFHPEAIARIAVGRAKSPEGSFTPWERVLSDIVVDDAFGVDRMDYLQRDSLHAGVYYGRFDHLRLVGTLRILADRSSGDEPEAAIGVEVGGLESAEALLIARYMMWSQVYLHKVRLMYDAHLQDFLAAWLPGGRFSTNLDEHLALTDVEVLSAMRAAAERPDAAGHEDAKRIIERRHYRHVYQQLPADLELCVAPAKAISMALKSEFGHEAVKRSEKRARGGDVVFPVKGIDGRISSSTSISQTLANLTPVNIDSVFMVPEKADRARAWLAQHREDILQDYVEEEEDGL